MAKKGTKGETAIPEPRPGKPVVSSSNRPSALLDTRVIYCGDCLEQLKSLPERCVDLIYIDPPFNSNRNYEVFWGETKEKRSFEDRHASTAAYIDYMRPRRLLDRITFGERRSSDMIAACHDKLRRPCSFCQKFRTAIW